MSADYTFKWDKSLPILKQDKGFTKNLNLFVAIQAHKHMSKYTPMDTGMLDQTVEISASVDDGSITYLVDYASKNYYGDDINFSKEKHPLATSHWDEAMKIADLGKLTREAEAYRKKNTK